MKITKTKFILILVAVIYLIVIGGLLLSASQQIQDDRTMLGQLKLIFFPKEPVENQIQNFQQDLNDASIYAAHENAGWEYAKQGDYDLAISEYKKSIEIIQADPGEQWNNVSKAEMERINEESRVSSQLTPRHRLAEVYEKAGRYPEALEQIDWLLTHSPLPHVWYDLTIKKKEIVQKTNGGEQVVDINPFAEEYRARMELHSQYFSTDQQKAGQEYQKAIVAMMKDPIYQEKYGSHSPEEVIEMRRKKKWGSILKS